MNIKKMFEGRIERKNFLLGLFIFSAIKFIASVPTYIIFFTQHPFKEFALLSKVESTTLMANSFSFYTIEGIIFNVLTLAAIIWSLGIYSRRFHDIGKSGYFAVLILLDYVVNRVFSLFALHLLQTKQFSLSTLSILQIPNLFSGLVGIMVLYLLIKKGQPETNQYGEIPSEKLSPKNILLNKTV